MTRKILVSGVGCCLVDRLYNNISFTSDPNYDHGHGERVFINSIGAAWDYSPENLGESFFASDMVVFGGTAIVPTIHDNLTELHRQQIQMAALRSLTQFMTSEAKKQIRQPGGHWGKAMRAIVTSTS